MIPTSDTGWPIVPCSSVSTPAIAYPVIGSSYALVGTGSANSVAPVRSSPETIPAIINRTAIVYARPVDRPASLSDPHLVAAYHYVVAIVAEGAIKATGPHKPVPVNDPVARPVDDNPWTKNRPGDRSPGVPPGWVVLPAVGGNVNGTVLRPHDVLDHGPVEDVHKFSIIRIVSTSGICVAHQGFDDDLLPVEVFIPDNLQNGFAAIDLLNFDNCHILYVVATHNGLENDDVQIALSTVFDPDVVCPAIVIEVQVIDPAVPGVEAAFEVAQGSGFLEQFQGTFEAKEVSFVAGAVGAVLGRSHLDSQEEEQPM